MRVWRLADGTPVGEPLTGHAAGGRGGGRGAAGRHPGHRQRRRLDDGTVRVWRLADGTPVGEPLRGHTGWVDAVAVGALPDGTPVIVSGGELRRHGAGVAAGRRRPGRGAAAPATTAGWTRWRSGRCRTAPRSSSAAAARRHGAGMAAGRRHPARASAGPTRIGTGCRRSRRRHRHCGRGRHRRPPASAPATRASSCCSISGNNDRPAKRPDNGLLSGTSGAMPGEDLGTGVQPCATRARYPVHRSRKSGGEGVGTAQARRHPRSKAPIQL